MAALSKLALFWSMTGMTMMARNFSSFCTTAMSTILLWVVFSQLDSSAFAATSNGSHHHVQTTGWMNEPNIRGTFRLLVSCLFTLTLCVYTALHLNVYQQGTKRSTIYLHKAKWVAVGLLAPEIIVFIAWQQRSCATELTKVMNNLIERHKQNHSEIVATPRHKWTLVHGFYAAMGGSVFDTDDINEEEYIPTSPRLTITPKGIHSLAKIGYFPDISEGAICDKSKADLLAKCLVCLQAGWIIFQYITRKASDLPITFLEINTLGHVLCTLIMYCFWFDKPLNIREPTPITGPWKRPLSAVMFMSSRMSSLVIPPHLRCLGRIPEMDILVFKPADAAHASAVHMSDRKSIQSTISLLNTSISGLNSGVSELEPFQDGHLSQTSNVKEPDLHRSSTEVELPSERANERNLAQHGDVIENASNRSFHVVYSQFGPGLILEPPPSDSTVVSIREGQTLANTGLGPNAQKICRISDKRSPYDIEALVGSVPIPNSAIDHIDNMIYTRPAPTIHLDRVGVTRWKLASEALKKYPSTRDLGVDCLLPRMKNFSDRGIPEKFFSPWMLVTVTFATAAYGDELNSKGLHLTAWNAFFPTTVEKLLWRISGLIIAASDFMWGVTCLFHKYNDLDSIFDSDDNKVVEPLFVVAITCSVIASVAARIFLSLESFISIRKLPVEAYQLPRWTVWTQFLPHI